MTPGASRQEKGPANIHVWWVCLPLGMWLEGEKFVQEGGEGSMYTSRSKQGQLVCQSVSPSVCLSVCLPAWLPGPSVCEKLASASPRFSGNRVMGGSQPAKRIGALGTLAGERS